MEAKLQKKQYEASLPKRYTVGEEICNSITHGIGAGLAIAALVLLVVKGAIYAPVGEKGFYITSFAIYGASLFILYLMSTLYHALTPYGAKKVFAVFDHSCIYLLIAGTYTPLCLTVLRATVGWWLFGIIWGLALTGMTFYAIFGKKMRVLSVITYILMGWLVIFAIKPMIQIVPPFSLKLLVWGGVAYTVGCIFYAMKKVRWTHSIWHIFVMFGSILHFFSIYYLF
ncbi:MAG: hemolysin III family protein [Spirochaetia bacterium]|nr:hemolysin III family protein [Spirochaetia bacterium]